MLEQPDELVDRIEEPAYGPYAYARSLLTSESRVLDVGCGNGKVSAYLAESGATVDGIEPAANRANTGSRRVRYLSTMDPLDNDPELLPLYDIITYFDVLEHIVDPPALLLWSVGRLAPGGRIVAAIPNSAHLSFRKKVLRGDWSMSEHGLFDRTHVRFFDTRTAVDLRPAGTEEVDRRYSTPAQGWELWMLDRLPNLLALHVTLTWARK